MPALYEIRTQTRNGMMGLFHFFNNVAIHEGEIHFNLIENVDNNLSII